MCRVASSLLMARSVRGVAVLAVAAATLGANAVSLGEAGPTSTNWVFSDYKLTAREGFRADDQTAKLFRAKIDKPPEDFSPSVSFNQAAVRQGTEQARFGSDPKQPYFNVRLALPIPPDNSTNISGALTGMDPMVLAHNHSPGFEILPNGDALAVYFSARNSSGSGEREARTCFIQARLRHGAEQWDPPELFFDSKDYNDQSGLLWTDGNTIRFFGGGREVSPWLPFRMATSTDNGATWTLSLPVLDKPAADHTPQPIVNAFRGANGAIYFAMDAEEDNSFLWRSTDGGVHWHDMGGRTGTRHSTIIPLDDKGHLISLGGKNAGINGWTPMNTSEDWGATWSASKPSPFPALGGNQRPCSIRLASGHLIYVSDSYHRSEGKSPEGWPHGMGAFVAISTNNGASWHMKRLPVTLPHEKDNKSGTLGYATVRQAPNGVIHVLATMTHPCLHYEFNEAWVFSNAGDLTPESNGGKIRAYRENFANGSPRITWSARLCSDGRYLLDGVERSFHSNGKPEHEATYINGRKSGTETLWAADGTKLWTWTHQPQSNTATWTHYWPNGKKRVESQWNTNPQIEKANRRFFGLIADGASRQWNAEGKPTQTYNFANGVLKNDEGRPANASR